MSTNPERDILIRMVAGETFTQAELVQVLTRKTKHASILDSKERMAARRAAKKEAKRVQDAKRLRRRMETPGTMEHTQLLTMQAADRQYFPNAEREEAPMDPKAEMLKQRANDAES